MSNSKGGDVNYDAFGRMKYHPAFHPNHKQPWLVRAQNYLIEHYEGIGPEQVSFAIGRTIHTVMQRAAELRKKGLMPKATKPTLHRRCRTPERGCRRGVSNL